jgi:ubiquinone/menaquinone biosynthesis C-methylase UbiE
MQMQQRAAGGKQDGARAYQQQRYRSLDQRWVNWREQRIMAQFLTENRLAGGSLLDIPCGYGRFAPLCARLGMTTVGVDVRLDMVRLAAENHAGGRWVRASIFALPFADDSFDGVLCIRLFHHRYSVAERQQMLRELARVARRCVLLSFYWFTPVHALARHWRGTRGRLAMMSMPEFHELVHTCGLQVQQLRYLLPLGHAQTFVALSKAPHSL